MSLHKEIELARKDIRTDGYSVSIGEWISIYEKHELDIHPEFQRFFRWTPAQKSRLIESILLGIPIPQIFVAQRQDGVWDVVDGHQRLSTIYQFVGILRAEEDHLVEPLVLEKTNYLPSLQGKFWDVPDSPERSLTTEQRLLIKRSKIDVSIILRESEEHAKYELFQRLNTGGSMLSDQEVRNAILVMLNPAFYHWLADLASNSAFIECIALSDKSIEERYDMELALRFLALREISSDQLVGIGDIGDYLTEQARKMAEDTDFNCEAEEQAFQDTFDILNKSVESDAFRRFDPEKEKHVGGFLVSAFEAVALGIGIDPSNAVEDPDELKRLIRGIWTDTNFTDKSGSGIRASTRIPNVVPYGRERFQK